MDGKFGELGKRERERGTGKKSRMRKHEEKKGEKKNFFGK